MAVAVEGSTRSHPHTPRSTCHLRGNFSFIGDPGHGRGVTSGAFVFRYSGATRARDKLQVVEEGGLMLFRCTLTVACVR